MHSRQPNTQSFRIPQERGTYLQGKLAEVYLGFTKDFVDNPNL